MAQLVADDGRSSAKWCCQSQESKWYIGILENLFQFSVVYSVINAKTFLPVIDAVLQMINAIVQSTAFKIAERLHQNRWQFGCQRNWNNVTLSFYSAGFFIKVSLVACEETQESPGSKLSINMICA